MHGRTVIHEGSGRRRRWTPEEKGRIVASTFAPGAKVSEVARQYDLSPQHLFQWRRQAKAGKLALPLAEGDLMFAPIVTQARAPSCDAMVAIEVGGAVVRATWSTDFKLMAAVVNVLRLSV